MSVQRSICLCTLSALVAFSAQAQSKGPPSESSQSGVQLFGLVDMMAYHKQLAGAQSVNTMAPGGMSTSFWGVRGSEQIGGGLAAEFELTSFFRPTTGASGRNDADPFWSRSSWLGLKGDWGSVRMGRQTTLGFTNLVRFNAFGGSSNFNPSFLHNYLATVTQPMMTAGSAGDSAWNNVLSYQMPRLGGFTGAVFYARPDAASNQGTRRGINVAYAQGPFAIGATFENISGMLLNNGRPAPTAAQWMARESKLWSLGASYDFNVVKVFAQAISTDLRNAAVKADFDTISLGATVPLGAGKFMVSHAQTKKTQTGVADVKRSTTSLGYDYAFSKRTDLYAVVMRDALTGQSSGTGLALGMRHEF